MAKTSTKKVSTRNNGACDEHKHKHQKCHLDCKGRKENLETTTKVKRRKRLYVKYRLINGKYYHEDELVFIQFCTTISNLIEKYPILHQDGSLTYEDCLIEMQSL